MEEHLWRKTEDKWLINCPQTNEEFDPIIWDDRMHERGLCIYCGINVEEELRERQIRRETERRKKENKSIKEWW